MAYKTNYSIVVYTSCGTAFTFADGDSGNFGSIALQQIMNGADVDAIGSATGISAKEIIIPYSSVSHVEVSISSEEYTAPADEMCQSDSCSAVITALTFSEGYESTITPAFSSKVTNYSVVASGTSVHMSIEANGKITASSDGKSDPTIDPESGAWSMDAGTAAQPITNTFVVNNSECSTTYTFVCTRTE